MRFDGLFEPRHPAGFSVRCGFLLIVLSLVLTAWSCSRKDDKAVEKAEVKGPAPQFALSDLKGEQVKLGQHMGKVVLVEFFTTWCAPCQLAAPEIQSLYEKYKDKGLVVLGVTIEGKQEEALSSFVKQHSLTYPILIDDGATSRQYEVFSIPTSYLIDRKGIITSKHMGFNPGLSQSLSKEIEALL